MIERLIHSLQALAAPADAQLARFPGFVVKADELALDFADALLLISDCPQVELSAAQQETLGQLDAHLEAMSAAPRAPLWTDAAVRGAPEWVTVRRLAREALVALGEAYALPPSSDSTYIPGAAT